MRPIPTTLALVALLALPSLGDDKEKDAAGPPPYGDFLVVPLRVHVLTADDLPDVDCHLKDDDIHRILGKANEIWHRAGIHFGLESLVREPAERKERFKEAREENGPSSLGAYRLLMPESSRKFAGVHVYFVHQFGVNGVSFGRDGVAMVKETARLRAVPGGLSEPIPRVVAHELGHILGLGHRTDNTHLLSSGVSAFALDPNEVDRARQGARSLAGCLTVADLRKVAEAAAAGGEVAVARREWSWLAEVPGDGAEEARRRREGLPSK